MDYFQQKNIELYDFLNENFKINKAHTWSDISDQISTEKISATYKFFSELYPLGLDYSSELKNETSSFKSIHFNKLKPNKIINEVVRYSLYSDEIFVFHPLQNPSITNPDVNPIKRPKYWLQNFTDSLYFYIVLQKWVRAGIVKLIVNPYEYNLKLRNEIDVEAKKRVDVLLSDPSNEALLKDDVSNDLAELLAPSFKGKTKHEIIIGLLNMESPRFSVVDAGGFAEKIFDKLKYTNPIYTKLEISDPEDSLMMIKGGGNLESILYVAKILNGNIYTTNKSNWHQISKLDNVEYWTKVAHLYSKIELPFLNEVDTSFALNIREEDRLAGVRSELRKIYNSINTVKSDQLDERKFLELNEGFVDAIKRSESDWRYIKKDARNKALSWTATTIGMPVILNEVSLIPILLGSAIWLSANMRDEKIKMDKFRSTNPLSVYVDLQHNEPSFFSELRNCIL